MSEFNSELIYTLNIELPKEIKKQIPIYENSNSNEIAYDFCKENDLDYAKLSEIKNQIDSITKSKKNINNTNNFSSKNSKQNSINKKKFYHKSQKLFPYQYSITENYKKLEQNNSKKSIKSLNKSLINNKKNIFERLFNDAEIKRISYKRSCHFSQKKNNKNNNVNKSYLTLNNENNSQFSKLIDENCDRTYQKSYVFKNNNNNNKLKNCTFRPNFFNYQQYAKPKIIKNNNNNNNYIKITNKINSYVTLRNKNNFKFKNKRLNNLILSENNNLKTENLLKNKNINENNKISDISNLIFNL